MPNSRTYLDYLNEKIDISPANSQEELEAAELVRSLMDEHGLETTVQDFTVPAAGDLPHNVLYVVMFLGMLLSGILGSAVGLVGLLLVIAALALLVAEFSGHDLLGRLGPAARSQNVIGVHRATGPLVVKGNRPIVIVAHYDSPNEGLLYQPQLARYQVPLRRARFLCVIVVSVLSLLQAMPFLPTTARHVLWVLGILASLPLLIVGVSTIYARFAPCTTGANDNKASIAAMLGVMDAVRPAGDEAKRYMELHPHTEPEPEPEPAPSYSGNAASIAISTAMSYIGTPYVWAGESAAGLDCSGLTMVSYEAAGVYLTHSSRVQYGQGTQVPLDAAQPGDLVFWSSDGSQSGIYHVAIYLGDDMMIEAPTFGMTVRVTSMRYSGVMPYAVRL